MSAKDGHSRSVEIKELQDVVRVLVARNLKLEHCVVELLDHPKISSSGGLRQKEGIESSASEISSVRTQKFVDPSTFIEPSRRRPPLHRYNQFMSPLRSRSSDKKHFPVKGMVLPAGTSSSYSNPLKRSFSSTCGKPLKVSQAVSGRAHLTSIPPTESQWSALQEASIHHFERANLEQQGFNAKSKPQENLRIIGNDSHHSITESNQDVLCSSCQHNQVMKRSYLMRPCGQTPYSSFSEKTFSSPAKVNDIEITKLSSHTQSTNDITNYSTIIDEEAEAAFSFLFDTFSVDRITPVPSAASCRSKTPVEPHKVHLLSPRSMQCPTPKGEYPRESRFRKVRRAL